ncbi:MAG: hypothetical protein IKL10_00980 [Clostridia bacterium]|nr:hypothetical protein [Clostridia bacterium]
MKKILAVILSAVMVFCCIPFAASAANEYHFTTNVSIDNSNMFASGTTYYIDKGVKMTVPVGITLNIPANCELVVSEGATLEINESVVVVADGVLTVEGKITGAERITCNNGGTARTVIRFPSLESQGLIGPNGPRIEVSYAFSSNGNIYEDLETTDPDEELDEVIQDAINKLKYTKVPVAGDSKVYAPLNQYVFIKAEIVEPDKMYDKFDDAKMDVNLNGIGVPFRQGSHHTKLTNAADVTYSAWPNDDYFLNSFKIYLPSDEGYRVIGREGEQSELGETVTLKYGQSFSFRVEIDEAYDMSQFEVYIYNGYGWTDLDTETLLKDIKPAQPDKYGYYTISEIKGEHTIYVVGIMSNDTILMVGDILDLVRNIFNMITEFFAKIAEFFGISTGTPAA